MLFVRKGWLQSNCGTYILAVTMRPFAFRGAPQAVKVGDVVIVQNPALGDEDSFTRECQARIERDLGMKVEALEWEPPTAASQRG